MIRPSLSLRLVLAVCAGLLVTAAVPAHAIQYMTRGEPGGGEAGTPLQKTIMDKLKKKWEEQPEVVKEEVQEQVDKAKGVAKDKVTDQAKKAGEKAWKKIKKSKTFGKYAKKAEKVLRRYKRVLGPVGQVWDAAERGYETGGKIHQLIVGPLMAAHFDRQEEEMQRQLQEDIARIRRNAKQRSNGTPDAPAPEPDTLEHYADQQLQDYLDSLPPMDDSQEFAEVLEQYNEASGNELPAPSEATAGQAGSDPGAFDWAAHNLRLEQQIREVNERSAREAAEEEARRQRAAEAERERRQRNAERERREQDRLERENAARERDYNRRRRQMIQNPDPYGLKALNKQLDTIVETWPRSSSGRGYSQGGTTGSGYSQDGPKGSGGAARRRGGGGSVEAPLK